MARVAHDLGFGAADRARPQRRGRRASSRRWTTTSAAGRLPEGLRCSTPPSGRARQGDGAAAGDGLRGDRQRRQAVRAADRRARRDARRARWCRSSRRGCAGSSRPRPRRCRRCARRCTTRSTSPRAPPSRARVPGLEVAGKTGTAQVEQEPQRRGAEGDENNSHAWFASFAPPQDPEIAVVVLVEHGGFGAKAATPTAMEIYRRLLPRAAHAPPSATAPARRSSWRRRVADAPRRSDGRSPRSRKLRAQFDWPLFGAILAIIAIGLVNLYSATRVAPKGLYQTQLMWFAVGGVVFVVAAAIDYRRLRAARLRHLRRRHRAAGGGARRRQDVKGSLALARLRPLRHPAVGAGQDRGHPRAGQAVLRRSAAIWRCGRGATWPRRWRCWALPMLLIMKQPDLGTALILYLIATTIMMVVPLQLHVKLLTLGVELAGRHRVLPLQAARLSEEAPADLHRSVARSVGRRLARAAGDLRRRQRPLDRQGLAARHAEPAAVPARALDRFSLRRVGRGVGLRRLRCCCSAATCS